MDITEINPVEYGGAIAHVAAAQLFQILTASENMEGPAAVNWFGGEEGQDDAAATVLLLAEYVTKRGAGGERLWIWGSINGLIVEGVPESQQFGDAPLYRRLAFDMFASVCLRSFEQLTTLQEAEFAARQLEQRDNPPIRLEDSIFEPTGSMFEIEKHAGQFLDDLAAADARRAEVADTALPDIPASPAAADRGIRQSLPGQLHFETPMSIGAMAPAGEANEEEATDQGQEAGDQAGADPDGANEVREGNAGDGTGGQDPGNDGSVPAPGENAEAGKQVAQPANAQLGGSDGGSKPESTRKNVKKPPRRRGRK